MTVDSSALAGAKAEFRKYTLTQLERLFILRVGICWKIPIKNGGVNRFTRMGCRLGEVYVGAGDLLRENRDITDFESRKTLSDTNRNPSNLLPSKEVNGFKRVTVSSLLEMQSQIESLVLRDPDPNNLRIFSCISSLPVRISISAGMLPITRKGAYNSSSLALDILRNGLTLSAAPTALITATGLYDDFYEVSQVDFIKHIYETDLCFSGGALVVSLNADVGGTLGENEWAQDEIYGHILYTDVESLGVTMGILSSHLVQEYKLTKTYDRALVIEVLIQALILLVDEMEVIGVIFRRLAMGLRSRIVSRISTGGNLEDVASLFQNVETLDMPTLSECKGAEDRSSIVILGPRVAIPRALMKKILMARNASDLAMVDASEAILL